MDLSSLAYLYVGLAAFLVGFTKTSVGGVGILAVLLMALAIPGKASPGVLLPMLIAADIMAVIYYRRACQWHVLIRLMPAAFVGVVLGYFFLKLIPDVNFEQIIGWIILSMLAMDLGLSTAIKRHVKGRLVTAIVGMVAGATSMIANAAGPVFGIYLLQMGLNKSEFVGTRSWYFLVMNMAKLPFAIGLGLVTPQTLTLNLTYLPVILIGAVLGYKFLNYINIRVFGVLIRVAVLASAARLILY
ncbi:MAG: permease [SAR86 cluster bacterium]|uniref:Probable membrane transporter protein n=1 Tax=SAR86 cluster bacterium TaxID=2030880 RepID=A0A2A4X9G9_9GAMM|nr:sulfite exporter TauE/SafE family protein [Sneathiella sp.]PCI78789.1 MAG: permease [SAR86 cluster bacterium]